jgi:hypothetical protein
MSQHDPEKRHRRNDMPDVLYVGLQEDDKIVSFGVDAGSDKLVLSGETPAAGAPCLRLSRAAEDAMKLVSALP